MNRPFRAAMLALSMLASIAAVAVLPGCASFQAAAPKTAAQTLGAAEIAFTGAVATANAMYATGVITRDQAAALVPTFEKVNAALDTAETLLAAGNAIGSTSAVNGVQPLLDALIAQLVALKTAQLAKVPAE